MVFTLYIMAGKYPKQKYTNSDPYVSGGTNRSAYCSNANFYFYSNLLVMIRQYYLKMKNMSRRHVNGAYNYCINANCNLSPNLLVILW